MQGSRFDARVYQDGSRIVLDITNNGYQHWLTNFYALADLREARDQIDGFLAEAEKGTPSGEGA